MTLVYCIFILENNNPNSKRNLKLQTGIRKKKEGRQKRGGERQTVRTRRQRERGSKGEGKRERGRQGERERVIEREREKGKPVSHMNKEAQKDRQKRERKTGEGGGLKKGQ